MIAEISNPLINSGVTNRTEQRQTPRSLNVTGQFQSYEPSLIRRIAKHPRSSNSTEKLSHMTHWSGAPVFIKIPLDRLKTDF